MGYHRAGGIYKITCKINNKCYIGKSMNIFKRWETHILCNEETKLQKDIKKYGIENFTFEILELADKDNKIINCEEYYIEKYDAINNGYNTKHGSFKLDVNYFCDNDKEYLVKFENEENILYFSDWKYVENYFNININEIMDVRNGLSKTFKDYIVERIINDGSIMHKYINPEK